MRLLLFLTFLLASLQASNLLTYNIYERSDRVDIMLSFDSPYEGKIFQKRGENITTLGLEDLSYDKLVEKTINSDIIQGVTIEPNKNITSVILKSKNPIAVIASKTVDGFGLRIRTKPIALNKNAQTQTQTQEAPATTNNNDTQTQSPFPFETAQGGGELLDSRYISVIAVLIILLLFMLWLKKRVINKTAKFKEKGSWLFKNAGADTNSAEIQVLHQKPIDGTNSVVLLMFEGKKYLVMTGNSNLLLEKFSNGEINDNSDFEKAFEDNRKKLDEYLRIRQQEQTGGQKSKAAQEYISKLERH